MLIVLTLGTTLGGTDRNIGEIEALYRQHGAALLLFASAISRDRARAQDAVHQVFLKVIENGSVSQAINWRLKLWHVRLLCRTATGDWITIFGTIFLWSM